MSSNDADWSARAQRAALRAQEARERAESLQRRAERLHAGAPATASEMASAEEALARARAHAERSREELQAALRRSTAERATDAVDVLLAPWPDLADADAVAERRGASSAAAQVVRHQIRTPLTKIICHLDLLTSRPEPMDAELARSIEVIADASAELSSVLVGFSRLLPGEDEPLG